MNVGGTGKLAMRTLNEMCVSAGLAQVRTYIASGDVVFGSDLAEGEVRSALEERLHACAGRRVGVSVRIARVRE